jgi:transcriptional regulator with XRE-family HTH domain
MTRAELGRAIASVRQAEGWTQAELADKLDVRQSSVSEWERGANAPLALHLIDLMRLFPDLIGFLVPKARR